MLKRVLTSLQYTCDEAEDGEIAVEKVRLSLVQSQAQVQEQALSRSQHNSQSSSLSNSIRQQSSRQPFLSPRQRFPPATTLAARGGAATLSPTPAAGAITTTTTATGTATATVNATTPALSTVKTYDLILCDNIMPNMCGPEAVALMRKIGYRGPIFGVTGTVHTPYTIHTIDITR